MLSALSAETLKLRRHRATWFLVWIYPIGLTLLFLLMMGLELSGIANDRPEREATAAQWMAETAMIWTVPTSGFGRYLIAAFAAVVFAGEYGWNTWKLIVPHRSRALLITAKYVVVSGLFYSAFVITAALWVGFSFLGVSLTGDTIPAGVGVVPLLETHGAALVKGLPVFFYTLSYASLAAILTRSMLAGLILAIVVTTAEQLFTAFAALLHIHAPSLVLALFQILPGYHLRNIESWIDAGQALQAAFPLGPIVAHDWPLSLGIVAFWTALLVGISFWTFRRQDLN